MSNKISQEEFQKTYGGDLGKLQSRLAVQPKNIRIEEPEDKETKRKKYVYEEYKLQVKVANYLTLKYPKVLFESSPINLRLTHAQRKMMKAINKPFFHPPDIKIYLGRRGYDGFALELKKETPYLKDGVTLQKNEHLANQQESIKQMREANWLADFYWNFDVIRNKIDWYLGEEKENE